MLRSIFVTVLTIASTQVLAWDSPREAVERFVQFDLDGGRLALNNWAEYVSNYFYAPADYDEPGWDSVVVVNRFSIGDPECVSNRCTVAVTYQLAATKSLTGPSVIPHEEGGSETLTFSVIEKGGVWKIDPKPDYPRISVEKYKQF